MPPPVFSSDPLVPQKSFAGMGRQENWWPLTYVPMNSQDDHAVPFLSRPIIGGVHLRHADPILTWTCLLKATKMFFARFVGTTRDVWMRESSCHPAQVVGKRDPGETANVLENKTARLDFADGSDSLGPHVSAIFMATMSAADRKWVTSAARPPPNQFPHIASNLRRERLPDGSASGRHALRPRLRLCNTLETECQIPLDHSQGAKPRRDSPMANPPHPVKSSTLDLIGNRSIFPTLSKIAEFPQFSRRKNLLTSR